MIDQRARRRHGRGAKARDPVAHEDAELEEPPPSPPGDRPEWIATWTFVLGNVGGASSLGVFAMSLEQMGSRLRSDAAQSAFGGAFLATTVFQVLVWAFVLRASIVLRPVWAALLLGLVGLMASAVSAGGVLLFGIDHPPPSLFPTVGSAFAVLLAPALLLSFLPVLVLARRVHEGVPGQRTSDVTTAGLVWAIAVSALGISLAPALGFTVLSALVLILAAVSLRRSFASVNESDPALADQSARATLLRGLRTGGLGIALLSLLLLPLRLRERSITQNPAVLAIYAQGIAGHCDVRRAGHEGDISLWLVDCGSNKGPTIGWDEREHLLLRDEQLFQRVPRLRSVPQISTAQPR